ncbi:MAG: hypothetical protein IH944_08265 [Armatimonadetes bacterium]|nr:hypothetical protein [Armatimonadota bacterium]
MRAAVIDVGSNSILLLVAEFDGSGWRTVFESSEVTGLGTGLGSGGELQPESMSRTLDAIAEANKRAAGFGAAKVTAVGTMALRIASNCDEFREKAAAQGTPVEVISGEREAELGLLCVLEDPVFASHECISIVDPGGHSTEIVIAQRDGDSWSTLSSTSYRIGALGLCDEVLGYDSPNGGQRLAATSQIDSALSAQPPASEPNVAVTLGATGTNLVTMRERMTTWDAALVHGAYLSYSDVGSAVGTLCDLTAAERAGLPGLEKGRELTIHAGALILERCLYLLRVEGCFVSTRGWRHALLEQVAFDSRSPGRTS